MPTFITSFHSFESPGIMLVRGVRELHEAACHSTSPELLMLLCWLMLVHLGVSHSLRAVSSRYASWRRWHSYRSLMNMLPHRLTFQWASLQGAPLQLHLHLYDDLQILLLGSRQVSPSGNSRGITSYVWFSKHLKMKSALPWSPLGLPNSTRPFPPDKVLSGVILDFTLWPSPSLSHWPLLHQWLTAGPLSFALNHCNSFEFDLPAFKFLVLQSVPLLFKEQRMKYNLDSDYSCQSYFSTKKIRICDSPA